MAFNAVLKLAFKLSMLLCICKMVYSGDGEITDTCEVIFLEHASFYEKYGTVKCVKRDFDPSLSSKKGILKIDCDLTGNSTVFERGNSTDAQRISLPNVTNVLSDGCLLRPTLFESLHLPEAIDFSLNKRKIDPPILLNNSFEGLCKLRTIFLFYSGINSIEKAAFHCVNSVERLDLSHNLIETIPLGVFEGMATLTRLDLGFNRIRELSRGVFDDLTSLRLLNLHHNSLTTLPEEIFRHQTSLVELNLNSNYLRVLNGDTFANLAEHGRVDLRDNELTDLFFSGNVSKLSFLDLGSNSGLTLTDDTFAGLRNLETLYMDFGGLRSLPDRLFANNAKLSSVSISRQNLQEIGPKVFSPLRKLKNLDLCWNDIHTLRDSPFKKNRRLESLHLHHNSLSHISADYFRGLSSLQELTLLVNGIESIDDDTFDHLVQLKSLQLQVNLISSLHSSSSNRSILSKLTKLERLYLGNNKLRRLTNVFVDNGKLERLVISRNPELQLDNYSFAGLFDLARLEMEECNIEFLPSGLFADVHNLEELQMRQNHLKEITFEILGSFGNLTVLDLDFNDIAELSGQPFANSERIRSLHLRKNKLLHIKPDDFVGLSSLEFLDVSSNTIEIIFEGSFHNLPNLTTLNISRNLVSSIEGSHPFRYNEQLESIDASHNRLTDVRNIKWEKLPSLREILLDHNEVRELFLPITVTSDPVIHLEWNQISRINILSSDADDFWDPVSKTRVYLAGNPLQCDCQAYSMYKHVREYTTPYIEFMDDLRCQRSVGEIPDSFQPEIYCSDNKSCPRNCSCTYSEHYDMQMVNCSNSRYASLPVEIPPNTNILLIDRNNLTSLSDMNELLWGNLTYLQAESNSIVGDVFFVPKNLMFFGLKGNRLTAFPIAIQNHAESVKDFRITLSNNPWPCDCSVLPFRQFLLRHSTQVNDIKQIRCTFKNGSVSTAELSRMEEDEVCLVPPTTNAYL